jgi:flavorubredoxin
LHGPVLKENLGYYLDLYNTWSSYGVESEGIMIAYTSVYGNTKKAVELLAQKLVEYGCPKVVVTDLARSDMTEAVEDAFRYGKLVLATTTYNGEIFPFMREFICHLTERNFQNRRVAFIENGSWAPMATRVMNGMLEKCKNLQYAQTSVKIVSSMSEENKMQIEALAKELVR